MELLLRVLDDGMATRLYRRICDERGLCYEVSAGYEAFEDCGVFDLAAETSHDSTLAVLEEMLHVVSDLKEKGPTERELDKARARHRWQLSDMLDRPEQAADFHGALLLAGMPKTASERIAELDAVRVQDVRAAAERLFRSDGFSVVAVGLQSKAQRERLEQAMKGFA
jgi:predicted Zn-dependent peptidase